MAARMPQRPKDASNYLKQMENGDRANARVADKVMLALPKELNQEQRVDLVRGFADDVTKGRASWLAAIHDKGKDAGNPHCHLLIRDRCPETGKRVIGMSESGSTEMLRAKWEQHANRALEQAGHSARIDRRSLKAQGIDRAPTIHEGPNVRAMEKRGARPQSRVRGRRNGRGARRGTRQVDYPSIDRGQTRPGYNRALRAQESEADYWAAIDQDSQRREFEERGLGADFRRRQKAAPSQRPNLGNTEKQPDIGKQSAQSLKEVDVSDRDEWLRQQHLDNLDASQLRADQSRARFDDLMKRSYLDPAGAEKAMDGYRNKHGEQALYDRLNQPTLGSPQGHGMKFGRRPGSILSKDGLKKGADERRQESLDPRRQLADGYRQMHQDREGLRAARQAVENSQPPHQPDNHQQQAPAQSAEPHPGQQHRGLEQEGRPHGSPSQKNSPDWSRMSPDQRQARQHRGLEQARPSPPREPHPGQQHRGLEQKGQPKEPAREPAAGPDWSRMGPDARQANQHRGLVQPGSMPLQPAAPAAGPAGAAAPLAKPVMSPAPGQGGGKGPTANLAPKKRGMEM
ncbi:hypothetical protein ABIA85_005916 [Bradyrhizobium sp. LA6.10]|uniref:MobA/MobL family protein n=1 Tax=Bradyrhizobium sp. LA6.10 TaxID=3156318 RepID=UPI003390976F